MTTIAILPIETTGSRSYQAVSGRRMAVGNTAGAALDALTEQFPDVAAEPCVVVQRFQPDSYFSAAQQKRLQDLFQRWRNARDGGGALSPAEQAELESLVDDELAASGQRAADLAGRLAR